MLAPAILRDIKLIYILLFKMNRKLISLHILPLQLTLFCIFLSMNGRLEWNEGIKKSETFPKFCHFKLANFALLYTAGGTEDTVV